MKKRAPRETSSKGKGPDRDDCLAMARTCLSASLRRTERLVTRHYDSYLADAGVTAVQLPMLATIAAAPAPTFRLLTEQLDIDRSTLSRNLALLERIGYVSIGPPSGPKPGPIALTAKGREVLRRAHQQWKAAHAELMAALDSDSVTGGMEFLKKLRRETRRAAISRGPSA
jgi:DNA-binding MarR family transcriptional regulator